jgi:hypothetical protein
VAGRIRSIENSNGLFAKGTGDVPVFSIVPAPYRFIITSYFQKAVIDFFVDPIQNFANYVEIRYGKLSSYVVG